MGRNTSGTSGKRLFFIDNLRTALVILVVLHHLAIVYAGNTPFYYVEPAGESLGALLLVAFQLFNQAFFMGFLFLLAGYFTPGSYERRGPGGFVKDKLLRLGVPIILYMFVLNPLASIGSYQMPAALTGITEPFNWSHYIHLVGIGPLWFALLLLIFDLGYMVWRMAAGKREKSQVSSKPVKAGAVILFMLALALTSYLLRIEIPLGKYILGFPSLAYLPQYISFFLIGIIARRQDWLRALPGSLGRLGWILALIASAGLFPIAFLSGMPFLGGGSLPSAVYALWDAVFSVGICLAAIPFFRSHFDRDTGLNRFGARHSFTVYIFHIPVIVFLALALREVHLAPLLKFGLAAVLGVPLCFVIACPVRKIPYAEKIL